MRVLQVHTTYREAGGEDSVVRAEGRLLERAGHVVTRHHGANPHGIRTALTLAASPYNVLAGRSVVAAARRADADVAHVHNTWYAMGPAVPTALARAGVPVVVTLHNYRRVCVNASLFRDGSACTDCVGRAPWAGVRHRCYRDSAVASAAAAAGILLNRWAEVPDRFVGVFLALNSFMADILVRGGLPADKVVVKGNSTPDPGPRAHPPSAGHEVVVLGRVESLKGIDVLVDAWEQIRPAGLELVVVGDGPLRAALEARAVEGVRFTGSQTPEQVGELLLRARALVLASRLFEGQPMSVVEAMAAGLPVLAPDAGGNPELLSDLGPDWLVPPTGVDAWVGALTRLVSASPSTLDTAGQAARSRWERDHTESVALEALRRAYARAGA